MSCGRPIPYLETKKLMTSPVLEKRNNQAMSRGSCNIVRSKIGGGKDVVLKHQTEQDAAYRAPRVATCRTGHTKAR